MHYNPFGLQRLRFIQFTEMRQAMAWRTILLPRLMLLKSFQRAKLITYSD
jgi:hypothetical protein